METKAALRKQFQQLRHSLTEDQLREYERALLQHFAELDLREVHYLHLFLPITHKREINTRLFADWIRKQHPEIKLVLSKSNFEDHSLHHILWEKDTPLAENAWGITEPQAGKEVNVQKLDMILVPLLGFDQTGNRVGYGKGFYDRFLADCRPDARKIGLSYFEPVTKIADANDSDIRLDACITPQQIWYFFKPAL